jgi:outer membrane protein assembly factor BamB
MHSNRSAVLNRYRYLILVIGPALAVALLLATATPVAAETVVGSIPAPDYAGALTWDGSSLWCGMYGPSGTTVYQLDPEDGTVLSSFTGQGDDSYGLAWDGSALWQLDSYNYDTLFRMDTSGGLLGSIPSITTYMAGLTWDGTYLWCAAYYDPDGWIYQIDPATGLEVHSFAAPAHQPWGLTWDGTDLWYVNDDFSGEEAIVYRLDPTDGTVLEQFDSPGANPRGLAWDGTYLWVCADNNAGAGRRCYQVDPGGSGTPDIDLPLTSHDYGIIATGTTGTWLMEIDNAGTADLTITGITSNDVHFTVEYIVYPFVLGPGGFTLIEVYFDSAAAGDFEATITVTSDDPDEAEVTVGLAGTAVPPDPLIGFSAASHDYDQRRRHSRSRWPLTITNNGYAPLVISDMAVIGAAPGDLAFVIPDFVYPITLTTFEELEVDIDFTPPDIGAFSGALEVTSNSTVDGGLHTVDLHGTGRTNFLGKGLPLWVFQGVENVECTAQVPDVTGDGITDAAVESYDAGASSSEPHLSLIWGNSDGEGVVNWGIHPPGGPSNSGGYGDKCLDVSPDINGDGLADVLLATAWGGCTCYAVNGRNGGVLWSYDMYDEDPQGGWVYAAGPAGDINGDKVPDALFGAGGHDSGTAGPRSMYAFDGASSGTAGTLWRQYANDAIIDVVNIGDVNGDGVNDAAACAGGNIDRDNHVYCVSGASSGPATTLWAFDTGGDNWSLTRHSDVTGDGVSEVVVGTWGSSPAGSVQCLDGTGDSTAVWIYPLAVTPVMRVDSFADVTGDGINEVLVASWAAWAYCLNGATGEQLWSNYMGDDVWAVSGIPDVNGDGYDDALAGAFTGEVRCIDGTSGDTIWGYMTGSKIFTLRWIEDVNGDTYADVLAGTQMLGGVGGELFCLTGGDLPTWDRHAGVRAAPRHEGIEVVLTGTRGFTSRGINVYRRLISSGAAPAAKPGIGGAAPPALNLPERIKALEARRAMHTALLDGFQRITPAPARGSIYLDRTAAPGARYEYILGVVTDLGDEVFTEVVEAGR